MLPVTPQTRGNCFVVFPVGPEGFEPPPSALKERCATVDTSTPTEFEDVVSLCRK